MVFLKLKASPSTIKLELFLGQDLLDTADDKKVIALLPIRSASAKLALAPTTPTTPPDPPPTPLFPRDKCVITAKLSQAGAGAGASSPDSSSDSSGGSPAHQVLEPAYGSDTLLFSYSPSLQLSNSSTPQLYEGPNLESEQCLPGVIMATRQCSRYCSRHLQLQLSPLPRVPGVSDKLTPASSASWLSLAASWTAPL